MRRLVLLEAVLIALCVLGASARAEGPRAHIVIAELFPTPGGKFIPPFAGNNSLQKFEGEPFHTSLLLNLGEEAFKVKASYAGKQARQESSNGLGKAEWRGLLNFLASSSFFGDKPLHGLLAFKALGSYTGTWSSDGLKDTRALKLRAIMDWNLGKAAPGTKTLSFKFSYKRHLDIVSPDSSHEDLSVRLLLKIASF
jgi:hypothetical protein